ncbi:hypothetical protein V1264_012057 [Littorina saxatilis]|uniref:FERM domain-containing protein n=2 Tax=Littorina saxatilis TaxID=31220 RepID=A0AAN9BWA6_9CAEN
MEVVLVVLRPKGNLAGQDYRHRLYEVLLLDSKTPPIDNARPGKYLPMFPTESMEEEMREQVLTEVLKITGGIKGERAVQVSWNRTALPPSHRESLSRFSLFCVPLSSQDKLNKRFVEQAHNSPVFWSLDYIMDVLHNNTVHFPSPTRTLLMHLENWLRDKHNKGLIESLFWSRAEYRIHLAVHNPIFIPSRLPTEGSTASLSPEIQFTANEAQAKMLAIEKCDIVVMNPLFGSGLPYNPKVNKAAINLAWPNKPIYSDIPLTPTNSVEPRWKDKYPLHASAAEGDVHHVQSLLNHGQHHSKKDSIAWAPIHYAAWYGSADVVEVLLDAGCSPNLTNSELLTPLHFAAKKGFPDVAEQLVQADAIDLNLRDKDGKRAIDICTSAPGRNFKHQQVANIIQGAQVRPNLTIEVQLMDKSSRHLRLVSGMQTTVQDINQQMLNEFRLPMKYCDIFTIWICSKSLELQLKAEHKLMEELSKWYSRTVEMLTEADPREEKPVFKWRRNAKVSVETERQITHPRALELLFHEAYHNYINGLYPCKDQDAIVFATHLFCIRFPGNASSMRRSFLTNANNLKELIPVSVMRNSNKGAAYWAGKIMKEYANSIQGKNLTPQVLKRWFLNGCQNLTVYGSAFFTGTYLPLKDKTGNIPCHVGVNDVGVHIINIQTKQMLHSYKYTEVNWELLMEQSILNIHLVHPGKNSTSSKSSSRSMTRIRTRQAGVIDHLMRQLQELNKRLLYI